jgi:CheY-like chemotaxis protein
LKKLLIVEDDDPKLEQLQTIIKLEFPEYEISIAKSLNSACKLLDKHEFDIALLDMSLPTFDGGKTISSSGRQKTLGGRDFLRYLVECEVFLPVFVITGFKDFPIENKVIQLAELNKSLRNEFQEIYRGNVFFSHSNDIWKDKIREILRGDLC